MPAAQAAKREKHRKIIEKGLAGPCKKTYNVMAQRKRKRPKGISFSKAINEQSACEAGEGVPEGTALRVEKAQRKRKAAERM